MDTVVLAPAGYLIDPELGSDYERPWRLAQGLARRGLRVVVVAREAKRMDELGPNVELASPPGPMPQWSGGRMIDRANLYWYARRIARREVAAGRAFIVHHLGPCSEVSPSFVGQLSVPFVYGPVPASRRAHVDSDEWQSWLRTPDALRIQGRLSRVAADRIAPMAHFLQRRTIERADAITVEANTASSSSNSNVVVIRPGIDIDQFTPGAHIDRIAGRIVAAGRFLTRKGYDGLIRAVSRVAQHFPSAHLLLVGSGPQEDFLRLLVSQLGIDSHVTFAGAVSRVDLTRLLQSAEVFCHPAIWESFFPAAPLEAMACGLPMAVSSAGALPELVGDFAGLVHTAGDDEELAGNLLKILTNDELRRVFATAARARIVDQFTWPGMCDAYFDLYQQLALRARSRSRRR